MKKHIYNIIFYHNYSNRLFIRMPNLRNINLLSFFTKKLSLTIIESDNAISEKYIIYLKSIFKEVYVVDSQKKFLNSLVENPCDILIYDLRVCNESSLKMFLKNVNKINSSVNTILFSKIVDSELLLNCLKLNVVGVLSSCSDEKDLKDFLKISIQRIFTLDINRFDVDISKKLTIEDCLKYLKDEDSEVLVVNHYKGMPIIRKSNILDIDKENVIIKADSTQLKTFNINDHIVLSSKHLGTEILTTLVHVDLVSQIIVLKYNNYIDSYVHHRKNPRVIPEESSHIIISLQTEKIKIDILDISIDHALCKLNKEIDLKIDDNIFIGINCYIASSISKSILKNYIIRTNARVKEIFKTSNGEKILFKFKLNDKDRFILDNYINHRITEILEEFKEKIHNN